MAEAAMQELKLDVRKSFAKVYSALKARELQTIRQIEAIWRQCGESGLLAFKQNCLRNIDISFENESKLFEEIRKFGVIDFKKLNLDSNIFIMEDYVCPKDDHMYSYKCLNELCETKDSDSSSLDAAIEEDAFKQITSVDHCVCYVNVSPDDVPKKFREYNQNNNVSKSDSSDTSSDSLPQTSKEKLSDNNCDQLCEKNITNDTLTVSNELNDSTTKSESMQKLNPTQDWLNQIINETETEPSQIIDLMEHSAIECS